LLYGDLTPVVEANRPVAVAMAEGPAAGLVILDALAHHPQLRRWAQLYIARAELLRRLGRDGEATDTYRSALELERAPASCPSWPDVWGNYGRGTTGAWTFASAVITRDGANDRRRA
jgi:hypothetical protein